MNDQQHIESLSLRVEIKQKRIDDLEADLAQFQVELRQSQRETAGTQLALDAMRERATKAERKLEDSERRVRDLQGHRVYLRTVLSQHTDLRCHSASDGECNWADCPQEREGEPKRSGRSCPLYDWEDREGRSGG